MQDVAHVNEYLCIMQPYGCHSRSPLKRPSDSNHLHESVPKIGVNFYDWRGVAMYYRTISQVNHAVINDEAQHHKQSYFLCVRDIQLLDKVLGFRGIISVAGHVWLNNEMCVNNTKFSINIKTDVASQLSNSNPLFL